MLLTIAVLDISRWCFSARPTSMFKSNKTSFHCKWQWSDNVTELPIQLYKQHWLSVASDDNRIERGEFLFRWEVNSRHKSDSLPNVSQLSRMRERMKVLESEDS